MKTLPPLLRRSPNILYGLAILFAVWTIINGWLELNSVGTYDDPTLEGVLALGKSKVLYQAFLEAAYLVASGALIQIMIAVHDKIGVNQE